MNINDISKINSNLPTSDKIDDLSDYILVLKGVYKQALFNKNEIDNLYSNLYIDRRFLRNVGLGNTVSTYVNWTHLHAESGYSIWKYTPSNYSYCSLNQLYFDDKLVENRGEANSELATTFDKVYLYNGDSGAEYIDNTTEAGTEGGTEFELMDSTSDYLYLGSDSTFKGVKFEFHTRGSNYNLVIEYYNDSSGTGWQQLTANDNNLSDNTSNFISDGKISWDIPSDWTTTSVNGVSKYWIRISTSTTPVTTAKAYYVIPGDSVIGLLALSSSQVTNEDWAWCSYNGSIYVTIRNTGQTAYEGNYYITSSSSDTNLKNFFVYNHQYTLDYQSSTYDAVNIVTNDSGITSDDGIILIDASSNSVTVTLPSASGLEGKQFIIKVLTIGSGLTASVDCQSGETIDGNSSYNFTSDYEAIKIISDGTNWYIIGKV